MASVVPISVTQEAASLAASLAHGTLYEIADHLGALLDTVDMCDSDELRAECEQEIQNYVELQLRKVDGIASYLTHCEGQQDFAKRELERLTARKKRYERRQERLEGYVVAVLRKLGEKKMEGRTSTLSLRACPASVAVLDESAIPGEFRVMKVEESIDKRAIKQALASKREVPGAELVTGRFSLVRD